MIFWKQATLLTVYAILIRIQWVTMAMNLQGFSNFTQTLTGILEGYDLQIRPNVSEDPVQVGIELMITSFDRISEVDMDFTITFHLNQYWKDDRLAFSTPGEIINLQGRFSDKIWVPDLMLFNEKTAFLHEIIDKNKMIRMHGDGEIIYGMRITATFSCNMDLHYYPMDSQECAIVIESYGYTINDMVIFWKGQSPFGMKKPELGQFTILDYDIDYEETYLPTGIFRRLILTLKMQRNIGHFMYHNYLPCIMIVSVSWVSFWINHKATSARVALGMTTVLTMTTINNNARSSLPRISYVKSIDIYMVVCFGFVFASLLQYSVVNHTFRSANRKCEKNRPKSDKNSTLRSQGNMEEISDRDICESHTLKLRHRQNKCKLNFIVPVGLYNAKQRQKLNCLQNFRQRVKSCKTMLKVEDVNVIDKYSRVIFPSAFILFNAVYFGFHKIIKIT